jgi:hypothetical protein
VGYAGRKLGEAKFVLLCVTLRIIWHRILRTLLCPTAASNANVPRLTILNPHLFEGYDTQFTQQEKAQNKLAKSQSFWFRHLSIGDVVADRHVIGS